MPTSAPGIRLIVSDVDGVWTDGTIAYAGQMHETKSFHVRDGLAVKLAQKAGIAVALLTSRRSEALERRAKELGVVELHQGAVDKAAALAELVSRLEIDLQHVAYIGDDLPDLGPMALCGLSAAPADAASEVLSRADWRLSTAGGRGAFRELVERLLRERGAWDAIVKEFERGYAGAPSI